MDDDDLRCAHLDVLFVEAAESAPTSFAVLRRGEPEAVSEEPATEGQKKRRPERAEPGAGILSARFRVSKNRSHVRKYTISKIIKNL